MMNDYDFEPGTVLWVFDEAESRDIENKWMQVFCRKKQGFNTKAFKWHIFSGEGYPSISGEEARSAYVNHAAARYIIMPNDKGLLVLTDELPTDCSLSDYYVFPENMAWTMAFTHEEGWLGPYFAKHPQYEVLQKENLKQLEKQHQKEFARQKGWF